MKKFLLSFLWLAPLTVPAQMPPNMDQAKMQKMMQQMQTIQSCMKNIDQSAMKAMEQRGRKLETELRQLCAQGKRDEAQTAAMSYALETAKNPTVQVMKKCGEQMANFLPKLPIEPSDSATGEQNARHVCDAMQ